MLPFRQQVFCGGGVTVVTGVFTADRNAAALPEKGFGSGSLEHSPVPFLKPFRDPLSSFKFCTLTPADPYPSGAAVSWHSLREDTRRIGEHGI